MKTIRRKDNSTRGGKMDGKRYEMKFKIVESNLFYFFRPYRVAKENMGRDPIGKSVTPL